MRRLLTIILSIFTITVSAQTTQLLGGPGIKVLNRGDFQADSIFYLPRNLVTSRAPSQAGALRYQASDSTLYQWTGTAWRRITGEAIDTLLISTRAWRQKGDDSLGALIGLRVRFTDTATMLTPYLRKVDTTAMLTPYVRTAGYGLTKGTQTLSVDTGLMATRLRVQKAIDSLAATEIDGSGTVNRVAKFTASGTVGNTAIREVNANDIVIGSDVSQTGFQRSLQLHSTNTGADVRLIMTDSTTGQSINSGFHVLKGAQQDAFVWNYSNTNLRFATNATERMRLTAAGRLLVGTTTEGTNTVDIAGTLRTVNGAAFATTSGEILLGMADAGDYKVQMGGATYFMSGVNTALTTAAGLHYMAKGDNTYYTGFNFQGVAASDMFFGRTASSDDLVISTSNTASPTERVRFKQNGEVLMSGSLAVGLSVTPTERLDVNGRIRARTIDSTASPINLLTSDVNGVIRKTSIAASGGVTGSGTASRIPVFTSSTAIGNSNIYVSANGAGFGLNDANPTQITNYGILNLGGSAGAVQYFKIADTIRGYFGMAAQTIGQPYTTSVLEITNSTSGDIRFTTASSEKVRLKNDGELVIGSVSTDAGNYRLQVNGSQYVSSSMNIANATVFDPNNKLEIYGPAFIRNTATAGSFRFDSTAAIFVAVQDRAVISISGGSHTGSNAGPVLSIEHTWNTSGDVNLIRADVTNTASGSLSNFIRLSDGTNTFRVNKSAEIFTSAPTGGTSKGWRLGDVSVVSPTSPNRTLRVEVDGTVYYIHAKTSND